MGAINLVPLVTALKMVTILLYLEVLTQKSVHIALTDALKEVANTAEKNIKRVKATWLTSGTVLVASFIIIAFFDSLFGIVIQVLTTILQPLSCLFYFIVVGWVWKRGNKLVDTNLQQNKPWLNFWGNYLRYVCPLLLSVVFVNVAILN